MFNKNKEKEESIYQKSEPTVASSSDVRKRKVSVIGPTLKFKGELSANEDLIIEGQIEGTIAHQEKNLTVGREGRVQADIDARSVEIFGIVEGDIRGEDVVKLAKSANVKGNIHCARIVMEDGAQFSGNIHMSARQKNSEIKSAKLSIAEPVEHADTAV